MRSVELEEFCQRPSEYMASGETLAIEREGRMIGRYIPASNGIDRETPPSEAIDIELPRATEAEKYRARERFERMLDDLRRQTGLTEDELAELLGPKKPLPAD